MAHQQQQEFCQKVKSILPQYFKNKKILDIGSLDVNGNNRELFENCQYVGLDIAEGRNVDVVSIGHLYDAPNESFDVIISTEVFEHDMFYEQTIKNVIRMLKKGGLFIFTCASTGRAEHGTKRCGQECAPLLISISDEWANYYKNLEDHHIKIIDGFRENFPDGKFEYGNYVGNIPHDLYFYGIKGGDDKLNCSELIISKYNTFTDDIFVIDAWTDTFDKKKSLVELIKRIKVYGIPILLVTHYPVETEIQNIVDYYIFDKQNELLKINEYTEYSVDSGFWMADSQLKLDGVKEFHHDYAIWKSLKHAFNFCKYLGKKNIHFLEYDNLPEEIQYRQCFLERINNYDAIIYEYVKTDIEYCSTYIFSIKTEVAVNIINSINSKEDYFMNRTYGWQLERMFLKHLKAFTSNILITDYIDNNLDLNKHAVWNRDGIIRNNEYITIHDGVDCNNNIFVNLHGGFYSKKSTRDNLIEINYGTFKTFVELSSGIIRFVNIGKYIKGQTIRCFLNGIQIYENLLTKSVEEYKSMNSINHINEQKNTVNVSWINGPKIEILGNNNTNYNVKFIDKSNSKCLYEANIKNNCWAQCSIKYYVDWKIEIRYGNRLEIYELDLTDKNVLIEFHSAALGDSLAWIEAVNQFQIKHKCNVTCKVFIRGLFEETYKNIKFIYPGDSYENIHIFYDLGIFYNSDNKICPMKHKENPLSVSLNKIADHILGVNTDKLKPLIKKPNTITKTNKRVCVATHSTSQCKYWNNTSGWNNVVTYLKSIGYDVVCIDKYEEFGIKNHMNKIPENCINKTGDYSLEERIKDILNCDFFIGLSSGLSWLAWACDKPVVLISGFTESWNEFYTPYRVINKNVCYGCWNDASYRFNGNDWLWCPRNKNFECTTQITFDMVKEKIDAVITDLYKKV